MTRKQSKPTPQEQVAKAFGESLKQYRGAAGMTQRDLAAIIGISQQSIVKYERGQEAPLFHNAVKLSRYFGFSLDQLPIDL